MGETCQIVQIEKFDMPSFVMFICKRFLYRGDVVTV